MTASRAAGAQAEVEALRLARARPARRPAAAALVRLGMNLAAAERRLAADDPAQASQILARSSRRAPRPGRAAGAHPRHRPLDPDRPRAARRAGGPGRSLRCRDLVDVDLPGERPSAAAETAAYFVVSEALTNVAKHSGATNAWVKVRRDDDALVVEVTDDGAGGASAAKSGWPGSPTGSPPTTATSRSATPPVVPR
ncbi:MAG: hypothetical protein U0R78_05570 [Nocardioidaceae bacterium]